MSTSFVLRFRTILRTARTADTNLSRKRVGQRTQSAKSTTLPVADNLKPLALRTYFWGEERERDEEREGQRREERERRTADTKQNQPLIQKLFDFPTSGRTLNNV